MFLDQDFEKWISKRLANVWPLVSKSDLKKLVNDCWEHGIKQEFDGDDREFTVTLPYSCARQLNQPEITLKRYQDKIVICYPLALLRCVLLLPFSGKWY